MMKRNRKSRQMSVAIELGHSQLHAAICGTGSGVPTIRCVSIPWRIEASSLHSDSGLDELTAAFVKLVSEENLDGQSVNLLLSGEYTVSRSVRGTEQAVRGRLEQLESLSSRYLLLGHGRKVAAHHIQTSEDGKWEGLLSVASERTLHALYAASERAGLTVQSVGASVVCLAGLISEIFPEDVRSGLLVHPRETGVDLAIIDEGRLLLDVHPVNDMPSSRLTTFITDRTALLQRFFQRNNSTRGRMLEHLFACGSSQLTNTLRTKLPKDAYSIAPFADQMKTSNWTFTSSAEISKFGGVIGGLLGELPDTTKIDRPDLLSGLQRSGSQSTFSLLARTLWPVAAAIIAALSLFLLTAQEKKLLEANSDVVDRHVDVVDVIDVASASTDEAGSRLQQLISVKRQVKPLNIGRTLSSVGTCLSESSSITSIRINGDGALAMSGVCTEEEAIFRFVHNLGEIPFVNKASMESADRPSEEDGGLIQFNVRAAIGKQMQTAEKEQSWTNRS